MISSKILRMVLMLVATGLSSPSSLPTCSISAPFVGIWLQPGLVDLITINTTWCSLKGTCIGTIGGQQEVKNKFIFYNEQTRCKRCVLFIPRHTNALQYRESECFDADDDNGRICASITPDTVLYTLFRDNAEPIDCPLDQSWNFKKESHTASLCLPKAFHNCFSSNTFQLSYNNRCPINQDVTATCLARFSDGNVNYVVARSIDRRRFVCFSYTKTKHDEHQLPPNEVYLFSDETCRDLLNRESAIVLSVLPGTHQRHQMSQIHLPEWTQGPWLSTTATGSSSTSFSINQTQLIVRSNGDRTVLHDVQFTRLIPSKRQHGISVRIHARSLQQCTSILYCVKLVYRSSSVIDLSMGSDEHGCKKMSSHYTLFKPTSTASVPCPQIGVYKSLSTYRSPLPVSTCSTGLWTLAIGCEPTPTNKSELTFSSTCRHDIVPDVQVITSIKGTCLASWRTDNRFQRTLVLYEQTRTFCLIQPVKLLTAAWILSEQSCTDSGSQSIGVDNSLRYLNTCQQSSQIAAFITLTDDHSRLISSKSSHRIDGFLCLFLLFSSLLTNKY